jgi:hypothetical protein
MTPVSPDAERLMRKRLTQKDCDAWNAKHPVGTVVTVRRDNGEVQVTKTRSAAEMLSGHTAVIWLEGISGCYMLDRVTADRGRPVPHHGSGPDNI